MRIYDTPDGEVLDESEPSKAKDAQTQNALAPAFNRPEEVEFVWWSWHPTYPYWSRSCWKGDTEEGAQRAITEPMAVGMRNYENVLVRESKRFQVMRPSVGRGNVAGAPLVSLNPVPASPVTQTDEEIARLIADDLLNNRHLSGVIKDYWDDEEAIKIILSALRRVKAGQEEKEEK